jgi:hypothetical protein
VAVSFVTMVCVPFMFRNTSAVLFPQWSCAKVMIFFFETHKDTHWQPHQ